MARSATPGWDVNCGTSVLKRVTSRPDDEDRHLWLSARALVLNSGSDDLWLSATGAVIDGGCRPWMGNSAQGILFRLRRAPGKRRMRISVRLAQPC
jgi:hypothetical protein